MASVTRKRSFEASDLEANMHSKRFRALLTPSHIADPDVVRELQTAFDELAQRLCREREWARYHLQSLINTSLSYEEAMGEMASLRYLVSQEDLEEGGDPLFSSRLDQRIERALATRKEAHKRACGDRHKFIPSGRTDYVLDVFTTLILPDDSGVSSEGIVAVKQQLGSTAASLYLKEEHRTHILDLLRHHEILCTFFSQPITLASSLEKFCCLDSKLPEQSRLSSLVIKRWILQMLMTDILQQPNEGNCYAISAFKFILNNSLDRLLDHLKRCLESGHWLVGDVRITIAAMMEMRLIRNVELDETPSSAMPDQVPIIQEMAHRLGFRPQDMPLVRTMGSVLPHDYAKACFCSYHRPLLQRMIIELMTFIGANGVDAVQRTRCKTKFITALINLLLGPGKKSVELMTLFSRHFWLWNCNPGSVTFILDECCIDGRAFSSKQKQNRLQTLLGYGQAILFINKRGETVRLLTFSEFFEAIESLIPHKQEDPYAEVIRRLRESTIRDELAHALLPFVAVPGFVEADFEGILYLSQAKGDAVKILDYFNATYSWVNPRAGDAHAYMRVASQHAQAAPLGARILIFSHNHAATIRGGAGAVQPFDKQLILAQKINRVVLMTIIGKHVVDPMKLLLIQHSTCWVQTVQNCVTFIQQLSPAIIRKNVYAGVLNALENLSIDQLNMDEVCQDLGCLLSADQRVAIRSSLLLRSQSQKVSEWGRLIRKALIKYRVGIFDSIKIEESIRRRRHLPPSNYVGDPNWADAAMRTHMQWRLSPSFTPEGELEFALHCFNKQARSRERPYFNGRFLLP